MAPKKAKALTKKQTAAVELLLCGLAPPGQFEAVAADIQKLLPSEQALSDAELRRLARLHWARHGGLGRREQNGEGRGDKVLLHAWAELEGAGSEAAASAGEEGLAYLDPASGRVVTVDHRTGAVVAEADAPRADAAFEVKEIEGVAEALAGYVAAQYATEAATSAVYLGGGEPESNPSHNDNDGTALFRVAIYAEAPNLRNFWAGSWLSLWTVARARRASSEPGGGGGLTIHGSVRVRAHAFEEGNMRMETAKACPPAVLDESVPLPVAVVAAIGRFESGLQRALDAAYAGLSEEGLKALRRKLTLSKQRMEWSAALHRVSRLK